MLARVDISVGYLDDMIRSKMTDEHRSHTARVFERLKEFGFKLAENECELFMS